MNKTLFQIGLGFVTVWDTVTTIYGTYSILGDGQVQIVLSILFGILLSAFLIRTIPIIKNPDNEDIIAVGAKVLWFLAILYDIYTSFTGNFDLILGQVAGLQKIIIAIGLTIFVSSAPIGLSNTIYRDKY
ncbi:MAG TPA: hypothetical protein DCR43_05590 [Bacteroidales bacterium]|nr:MAG: hypothetical protein A2X11_12260 [Bacteroidetes bacterium GWE2_42_24]OFY32459.1 MAG: hypothetical protein A2X09_08005 [Bacteroidetes bacterium GWF2_43_11]HAQ65307.1 hypothetical protein [Bacteroidales bacterium]HBZ65422.1 hypothetical protein [Bacteroidales bacterium]